LVGVVGHFRLAGDRIAFFAAEGNARYLVLENLNLQRIGQAIVDDPTLMQWRVSGLLTEFRGNNYLLVRSAVVESGPAVEEQVVR